MEKTYHVLACWRCRSPRLLPLSENDYRCPVCEKPVCVEDLTLAWDHAEEGSAQPLTADTWDQFVQTWGIQEGDQVVLEERSRWISWRARTIPELREEVDQGSPVSWLPPLPPVTEEDLW